MVPTMLIWFYKHMLELVFSEKKVNKLLEAPIMLLVNSNSWNLCYLSTAEKTTEEIPWLSSTPSTKIFCTLFLNITLDFGLHSLARLSTSHSSTSCTILPWPLSQLCTSHCSTGNTQKKPLWYIQSFTKREWTIVNTAIWHS